tara:strand:+ start:687 stop:1148 length:462 start_codon:yes stop_codon:yes gene_type:complete
MPEHSQKIDPLSDEFFMKVALDQAIEAYEKGEVPVGAIIVSKGRIIARAHNQTEQLTDVTAHAEILAMTSAFNFLGGKYLDKCKLYVTLEPCGMCAGAAMWAQLGELIFAASDDKRGYRSINPKMIHPRTQLTHGVLKEECRALLQQFFREKR